METTFSPFISPPISSLAYEKWTLIKDKACRSIWGSLLDTYPQSLSCNHYEAMGGTVYIMKFEKADLIDGGHQQECSLANSCKARQESWPVTFFVFH